MNEKDVEGICHSLVWVMSGHFRGRTGENQRIISEDFILWEGI
jgi:hypothetical protein